MNILTKDELQKIAKLSGLLLTENEEQQFLKDLQSILNYTKDVSELAVTEMLQGNKAINVFREDKVRSSEANAILQNAQAVGENSYFMVPKVLK